MMMNEELGIKVCVNNAYYYLGEVKVTKIPFSPHVETKKVRSPLFSLLFFFFLWD